MKTKVSIALLFSTIIFMTSCTNDDDSEMPLSTSALTLNLQGLSNLGANEVYEGWIMVSGTPKTTGTFTVNDSGELSQTSFDVDRGDLESATAFILSVEPANDTDPAPSEVKILSGAFSESIAMVNTNEMIGDFTNSSGTFFLRSPTDEMIGAPNNMNDEYGIWFGDIDQGMPPVPNFTLPLLDPTKWVYEGWVIANGMPISTGRFSAFDMQDDFNGFSQIGGKVGPNLPGEDFFINPPTGIMFPLDLRNRMVVISVEPAINDDPKPFLLKPLAAISGTLLVKNQALIMNTNAIPSGTVTR